MCFSPLLETLINWRNNPHFTPSQVRVNMFHHQIGEMAFFKVGISSKDWESKDSFLHPPPKKKIVGSSLMTIHLNQWFIHTLYFCYTRCIYNIWWEWPPLGPSDQILIESKHNRGEVTAYPIRFYLEYNICQFLVFLMFSSQELWQVYMCLLQFWSMYPAYLSPVATRHIRSFKK